MILNELLGEPNECFKALCPFKQVNATVTARFLSCSCCPVATIKRVTTRGRAEIIGGRNFQQGGIFYQCLLHPLSYNLNVQVHFLNVSDTFALFSF